LNVDTSQKLPSVIAFCAGYGGIERGLDLSGFEHRVHAYVEIEAYAIANLVAKMEAGQLPPAPIYTDLKTFPAELFRGKVDLITGGYPCQGFSAAGKRKGADDPRYLWPYIRRHIQSIRPVRCFFENVEGHISLGLSTVISDLEEDGYFATWGIFSAEEVGAPHRRKRVYILADTKGARTSTNNKRFWEGISRIGRGQGTNSSYHLGNSQHDGSFAAEVGRSVNQASDYNAQRQVKAGKLAGAGQPNCGANLSATNELVDSDSFRCDRGQLPDRASQRPVEVEAQQRPGQPLVRSKVEGCGGDSGEDELANSIGARSEVGLSGQKRSNKEGNARIIDNCHSQQSRWQGQVFWPPEPRLGRVVDGCANRVDRIRLLGNGVVPQTAARAWEVLNKRFWHETN